MRSRIICMAAIVILLLMSASPAASQSQPTASASPRLVIFEGFYNPS